MSKNSMIAACLCGLMWAGTAQAGFMNKQLQLTFLGSPAVDITGGGLPYTSPNGTVVSVGDTTVTVTGPTETTNPVSLTLADMLGNVDPITGAYLIPPTTAPVGLDPQTNSLGISGIMPDSITTVGVTFQTVPEPGALYLVSLGLMILGVTSYRRKQSVVAV